MGTILIPTDTFDSVVSPNPFESVRASGAVGISYMIAGLDINGGVIYTPVATGVRVKHLGGISMALAVTVVGTDITVQLATTAAGAITSTANDVVTAVMAVAAAIVTATAQGTGLGLAGVFANFMPLTDDPFGSVRPPFQALTNQATWLRNGVVLGTRTLRKVHADGTGALASAATNGEVWANNAFQTNLSASQGIRVEQPRIRWRNTGVGANDANPGNTIALLNELRALNIPKCFGSVETDGAGNIVNVDGASFTASLAVGHILITMATAMANNFYTVVTSLDDSVGTPIKPTHWWRFVSTTQFLLLAQNNFVDIDPSATPCKMTFAVFGRQTS